MTIKTLTLKELEKTQLKEIFQKILFHQLALTVQLPNGEEVIISPKLSLKPLPILEGFIPDGWKN
jgi:hypothetical protein